MRFPLTPDIILQIILTAHDQSSGKLLAIVSMMQLPANVQAAESMPKVQMFANCIMALAWLTLMVDSNATNSLLAWLTLM